MDEIGPERDPAEVASETGTAVDDRVPTLIVGIGASAGGLEPLQQLFEHIPGSTGIAFVVVQHLSPDFKSLMPELLGRRTSMPIHVAEPNLLVEADHVYLNPPKKNMVVVGGRLFLTDQDPRDGLHLPIDTFFKSLALDAGHRSVAMVLSGTGSDGSRGIRSVHEAGGIVMVQDASSAQFDGMPRNAEATGVADHVLGPVGLADTLARMVDPDPASEGPRPLQVEEGEYPRIFELVRDKYGLDFSQYKPGTVGRRIERRMSIVNCQTLADYVEFLENDRDELDALYEDVLIGVTRFFRDPEAFGYLEKTVLPQVVKRSDETDGVRVWVAGAASGEEVYSLAILLHEAIESLGVKRQVKIFATDLHPGALARAAAGLFSPSQIEGISARRLKSFFTKRADGYEIVPEIRQSVVFTQHNMISDPPFTRLDMVTCRNVLIYVRAPVQRKVLGLFHFGLKPGGILFLGPSETVGALDREFDPVSHPHRIYRKRRDLRISPLTLGSRPIRSVGTQSFVPRRVERGADQAMATATDTLFKRFVPPSLLINDAREVAHVFGDAGKFLRQPQGRINLDVLNLVDGDLRVALSTAVHRSAREGSEVSLSGIPFGTEPDRIFLTIRVEPIRDSENDSHQALVTFIEERHETRPVIETDAEGERLDRGDYQQRIADLERELHHTKAHLQSAIEDLETSNEELQSTNEELVASNEELQSTNEELHSVNEELYTVNTEYQHKLEELTRANNDMDNLLESTDIGTVFLDAELNVRRFTPSAAKAVNLMEQDIGRPVSHISLRLELEYDEFLEWVRGACETGTPLEHEVRSRDGRWLLVRVNPYRTAEGLIEGVVITFVDITSTRAVESELRHYHALYEASVIGLVRANPDGFVVDANPAFLDMVEYSRDDLPLKASRLTPDEFDDRDRKAIEELDEQGSMRPYHKEYLRRNGTRVPVVVGGAYIEGGQGDVLVYVLDQTTLASAEGDLKGVLDAIDRPTILTDDRDRVRMVNEAARTLLDVDGDVPETIAELLDESCIRPAQEATHACDVSLNGKTLRVSAVQVPVSGGSLYSLDAGS